MICVNLLKKLKWRRCAMQVIALMSSEMNMESEEYSRVILPSTSDDQLKAWIQEAKDAKKYRWLEILYVERTRREEGLATKSDSELEELARECYRRVRRMENYEWDVVADSDSENRTGFLTEIHRLEMLEAAANLERERREAT
jgi:hypothetical protein